jgi:hypothetical protein
MSGSSPSKPEETVATTETATPSTQGTRPPVQTPPRTAAPPPAQGPATPTTPQTTAPAQTTTAGTPPVGRSAPPPPAVPARGNVVEPSRGAGNGSATTPAPARGAAAGPGPGPATTGAQPGPTTIVNVPPVVPPQVEGPVTPPPPQVQAPLPQAATQPTAAPAQPDPARDEAAVREVLAQFSAGYQRLDAAAVRRLWPGAPATLQQSFADARSYQLTFENTQISVRGDTATVTTVRRIRAQPKAGRPQEMAAPTTFTLRRAGGGWVIESVR